MHLPQAAVIINPASANGSTAKRWPEIAIALNKAGLSYTHVFTERPGQATALSGAFLKEGYSLIIAVGGDGTANEVINGFFAEGSLINKDAAFAFLSTGTGRDLARTIGTSGQYDQAVEQIMKSEPKPIDIGKVMYRGRTGQNEVRYFINIAGLGLDGDTVARVNRTTKVFGGFISFLWGTVVSLLLYRNKQMIISVDDQQVCAEPVTAVVIGNGRYFGGGMCIAPHAKIDDGWFDVIILRNLSKLELLRNLPKVYRGTHLSHPKILSLQGRKIEVVSNEQALLDLDGEQPGSAPVEIELLPAMIALKA